MSMKGKHHSDAAKRKISQALTRPTDDDALALRVLGKVTSWEFAERCGISEQASRKRLERLVAEGVAERYTLRGMRGYTYVAVLPPNLSVLAG
jgi:predicted ArsR family transcriptional regulator